MKKWILLLTVVVCAWGCDAPNQSSEQGAGTESVDRAPVEPSERSDEAPDVHSDSTTTGSQDSQYDSVR
jgi:hypothetical protein